MRQSCSGPRRVGTMTGCKRSLRWVMFTFSLRRRPAAVVVGPTLLADAIDGVTAVRHQSDLLPHQINFVGDRGCRGDGQLRARRLVDRRVVVAVNASMIVAPAIVDGS